MCVKKEKGPVSGNVVQCDVRYNVCSMCVCVCMCVEASAATGRSYPGRHCSSLGARDGDVEVNCE